MCVTGEDASKGGSGWERTPPTPTIALLKRLFRFASRLPARRRSRRGSVIPTGLQIFLPFLFDFAPVLAHHHGCTFELDSL
jgi:hypothetical protein